MLTEYLDRAMDIATYKLQDSGSYYGEITACPGVWATGPSLEESRQSLRGALEDWVVINLQRGNTLPVIADIDLNAITMMSAYAEVFA